MRFWLLCLLPLLAAADTSLRDRLSGPRVAAHQGGLYGAGPNTLQAFEEARAAGADIIELDLRLSKDGVPIVYHDETLTRWTWCAGRVDAWTVKQLKEGCPYKLGGHRIPTFEDVLQWSQGHVLINAEFKERQVIAAALALVEKHKANEWVYFQAKSDARRYQEARELSRDVALLFKPRDAKQLQWALDLKDPRLLVIELGPDMRTRDNIAAIRAAGKFTSANSWHYSYSGELLGATCDEVFARHIDIAVSNRPQGCAKQRQTLEGR